MLIKIIRIEKSIVTCELEDGNLIDIDKKWFNNELNIDDIIDIDVTKNRLTMR